MSNLEEKLKNILVEGGTFDENQKENIEDSDQDRINDKSEQNGFKELIHVASIMESKIVFPASLEKNKVSFSKEYKIAKEEEDEDKQDEKSMEDKKNESILMKEQKTVLKNIHLEIKKGSFVAIIGE